MRQSIMSKGQNPANVVNQYRSNNEKSM
jgi:hypothetical protein